MMKVKGPGGPGENELLDAPQAGQQKKTMNNNKNNKNNNNNKPHFPYITHTPHDTHTTHGAHTQNCGCTTPTVIPDTHEDYRDEKAAGEKRAQEKNKPNDTTPEKGEPKAREEERDRNNPGVDPEYPDTVRHPPDGITAAHDLRAIQTGHTKIVKDFWDIPPFHASFLQRLSDRHRWVLYRLSFSQSPQQQFDPPHFLAPPDRSPIMCKSGLVLFARQIQMETRHSRRTTDHDSTETSDQGTNEDQQ